MANSAEPVVAYVPGVFDLFHIGHLNILRNARLLCDRVIAGVVSDERAVVAKGRRPVVPLAERLDIVGSIRFVDEAVVEDVPSKLEMYAQLGFDLLVKGDDWRGSARGLRLEADMATVGVAVMYLPYTAHISSSSLRETLRSAIAG